MFWGFRAKKLPWMDLKWGFLKLTQLGKNFFGKNVAEWLLGRKGPKTSFLGFITNWCIESFRFFDWSYCSLNVEQRVKIYWKISSSRIFGAERHQNWSISDYFVLVQQHLYLFFTLPPLPQGNLDNPLLRVPWLHVLFRKFLSDFVKNVSNVCSGNLTQANIILLGVKDGVVTFML